MLARKLHQSGAEKPESNWRMKQSALQQLWQKGSEILDVLFLSLKVEIFFESSRKINSNL